MNPTPLAQAPTPVGRISTSGQRVQLDAPSLLSLLIVTWNTRDLLRACLASIAPATEGVPYEVMVVDNASTDGTAEMVQSEFAEWNALTLIANAENIGFAAANNQAYRLAQGNVIAVVNPDIVLNVGALHAMLGHALHQPQTGVVSCRLEGPNGERQTLHRAFPTLPRIAFNETRLGRRVDRHLLRRRFDRAYRLQSIPHTGVQHVDQAAGACLLMRREVVDRVSPGPGTLFDERFPILGNDVDLCRRVHDAGLTVDILYDQHVVHLGSASLSQVDRNRRNQWRWAALHDYYALHEPAWRRRILRLLTPRQYRTPPDRQTP